MLRTLNRWQHRLFSACFHIPADMPPLKNQPWQSRPLQNRPLQNHPWQMSNFHARPHQPRILKEWQNRIGDFVEQYTAHK